MSEVGSVYGSPKCFQDKDKMFDEDEMFDSEQVDVGEAGQGHAIYELQLTNKLIFGLVLSISTW